LGAVFVEKISGSFSGVVGLPIEQTAQLLRTFNVPIWGVSNKNI
jgi:septum formation protein